MSNSDPYLAASYKKLHSDDIGKWGKHGWPLLTKVLEQLGKLGTLTAK